MNVKKAGKPLTNKNTSGAAYGVAARISQNKYEQVGVDSDIWKVSFLVVLELNVRTLG